MQAATGRIETICVKGSLFPREGEGIKEGKGKEVEEEEECYHGKGAIRGPGAEINGNSHEDIEL